jgi:hypothetical protein
MEVKRRAVEQQAKQKAYSCLLTAFCQLKPDATRPTLTDGQIALGFASTLCLPALSWQISNLWEGR